MKWQFEVSDRPINPEFPIQAYQNYDSGAKKGPFYLKVEDLIEALQAKPDEIESTLYKEMKSTPALPFGTIRYSVNDTNTLQLITMEIPMKQWEIRYGDGNEFYTIGLPRMVIQFIVTSSTDAGTMRLKETKIFSVLNDNQPITDATSLYAFPYPNVYRNGQVCWGQNQRLEIKEVIELERIFQWFISAPFNEDLGVKTTHGIPNFKKLIQEIQNKPFDDEWLLPDNKTFRDLFY